MKKIKESANKTVLLKYLNSFCCIANAALFILAEILVHLNPKDFHSEQSTASVLCIAIALTAVIFSVYYLASAKTESLSAEIVFIVVNIFLCCFVFWEELEVQYSLALDTVRIFLSVFIILLNAAIIQFNAQKAEYVFHKKRILLKANGIANLVRGILTALSSALIILYSRFADFDSLLPVLLSAAVIVLSCFLIKEQHWKMSGRYNEKTLINILFVLYYIYDIKKLLEEDLLYEQPVYFLNILLSMAIIALSLICIFDRFEFGPFEDKRGHLSFCADKALLPLSILLAVTVIANFVFCQKDDTLRHNARAKLSQSILRIRLCACRLLRRVDSVGKKSEVARTNGNNGCDGRKCGKRGINKFTYLTGGMQCCILKKKFIRFAGV